MNSVNASTGMSMFELRLGRSPHLIPPFVIDQTSSSMTTSAVDARSFLAQMQLLELEAWDCLTMSKVQQAFQADKQRRPCELFAEGDWVMLSTWHRRDIYKKSGEMRVAK
ncbi:hypothetical protein GYMLUDRAFT_103976, partial [Collybiopsis luxurians FD-317 M1]